MIYRPIAQSIALLGATIVAGLVVRFGRIGLSVVVVKYGGSMLWALAIYWLISSLFPVKCCLTSVVLAGTLATAVEFAKLIHQPALNSFRHTLAGVLLLGRIYSPWDLLAYWLAIALGAGLELWVRWSLHSMAARG